MILYENINSEFDQAFLIAHELGHVVLEGGATDDITENVDVERSLESPAVGLDRIIDYGSRERREAIMDFFAREFLVPRCVIRRWYLQDNLSSSDIANRLNAPLNVIQQQLLDALLLPAVVSSPAKIANKPVTLDRSQTDAEAHRGTPYQLQAGPGTGKTATLVQRIHGLLDDGIDPATILVLTFSNRAAGELRERIAAKSPEAVASLWIGTFHSFGLDIIHRFHDFLELSDSPRLLSRYEAIELLEDELTRLPLKHFYNIYDPTLNLADMLSAISRAKDEVVNAAGYRRLADRMLEAAGNDQKKRTQAEKCIEVALLYELYERLLKDHDAVDFGDLVSLPVTLAESNEDVRISLSARHQHILVDEYQDVNRASIRLLKAIAHDASRLWVVGDSRQSIYRFRGASSINMRRFAEDFPGAKVDQLAVNYRSASEVINLYTAFSKKMKASDGALPLSLKANRGASGVLPEFRVANRLDDEIAAIANAIEEKKQQGFEYKEQAVLCTSNKRLGEIAKGLESLSIPILYLGSLFERSEIKDLLSLLSLVVDKRAIGLVRAANLSGFSLTLEEISYFNKYLKERDIAPLGWDIDIEKIIGLSDEGRESLRRLVYILKGFSIDENPWSVLATLVIDRLKLAKKIALSDNLKEQMEGIAIWQLLNFCRKKINGKGLL